jgi:hypothetical protein
MDINFSSTNHAELAELEDILKFQRSGRQLSTSQMESLNDYVSRRFSMSSLGGSGDLLDFPGSRRFSMEFSHLNDPSFWQGDGLPNFNSNQYDGSYNALWNQRRRSSALAMQNFIRDFNLDNPIANSNDQMASGAPSGQRMEKRTSLDLLGDAAAALSNQEDKSEIKTIGSANARKQAEDTLMKHIAQSGNIVKSSEMPGNSNPGRLPMNRRSTLDMIMHGDGTLGDRRSSLSFILGQEFYPLSRNNSLGLGSFPPQHFNDIFDDMQPFNYMPMNDMRMQGSSMAENNLYRKMLEQDQKEDNLDYMTLQNMQEKLYRRFSQTGAFNNYEFNVMMQHMNQQRHQNNHMDYLRHSQGVRRLSSFETPGKALPTNVSKQSPSKMESEALPVINPERLKAFTETMEKSQVSQVSIQAWDKKMGLKRSHSATMTKTTRSRKALRELFEVFHSKLENDCQQKSYQKENSEQRDQMEQIQELNN